MAKKISVRLPLLKASPGTKSFIYGLVDPWTRKIRYVGASSNPRERHVKHMAEARRGGTAPLHQWLRGLAAKGAAVEVIVLEETVVEEVQAAERRWIAQLPDLVNGNSGGQMPNAPRLVERMRALRTVTDRSKAYQRIHTEASIARGALRDAVVEARDSHHFSLREIEQAAGGTITDATVHNWTTPQRETSVEILRRLRKNGKRE